MLCRHAASRVCRRLGTAVHLRAQYATGKRVGKLLQALPEPDQFEELPSALFHLARRPATKVQRQADIFQER